MEEFFEKLNKNAKIAAEKIDIWTQTGRLAFDKKKLESRLNNAYKQFGKKVYSLYDEQGYSEISKDEVSSDISSIDDIINEIKAVKEKIELLKAEPESDSTE